MSINVQKMPKNTEYAENDFKSKTNNMFIRH